MVIFIIIAIILFIGVLWLNYMCRPISNDSIIMINGPCGSGKSALGLWSIYGTNKRNLKRWKRKRKFVKMFTFNKNKRDEKLKYLDSEKPYIYSNIPLFNVQYKKFELEHLKREYRFEYTSPTYLNECSLVADSMLAMNISHDKAREKVNKQLQLFCKTIRHETMGKGICMCLETQNPEDLAMAGDRVLSESFLILKTIKTIPFFLAIKTRKIVINIKNVQNTFDKDSGQSPDSWHLVPKKVFKLYDSYCYEFLTRDKPKTKEILFEKCRNKKFMHKKNKPFIIPTLTNYTEILESNEKIRKENEKNEITKQN